MGPSRRVLSAIAMTMWLGLCLSPGELRAAAQQYDASLRSLEYTPDPLARSPRLLGMGRLTLADDVHNQINFWDFAGNPTGIMDAESLSTIEYRPDSRSSTALHDLAGVSPVRERQQLQARQRRHGFEAWHRSPGEASYGMLAEIATLQWDRPFNGPVQERGTFTVPALTGIVNGRLPWVKSNRFDFALRVSTSRETQDDRYFEYFQLPQGEYIGKPSSSVPPPDLFTPDHSELSSLGAGLAIAMRVTSRIKAAVGYDAGRTVVRSVNEGERSTSRTDERRPHRIGQASVVGRLGSHLQFGADGRAWRSESEEYFFWSISAGPSQEPLTGTGKRLNRKEEGTSLRSRARWVGSGYELGASFSTSFRRGRITPWYPSNDAEHPGFNDFLDQVGSRPQADTLALPERVAPSIAEERGYQVAAGSSWRLPGQRGTVGAEVHRWRRRVDQPSMGSGPEPTGWDVRAGGEYRCNATFVARAGGSYGVTDRDALTSDDAYRHTVATTGFGYQPAGSRWSLDLAFAYEWVRPDFPDPVRYRESHQRLALQSRWVF